MKIHLQNGLVAVVGTLAISMVAQGSATNVVSQTFSQTFSLTASPSGALPAINTTWDVNQYSGFGGLTSLSQVQYTLTTELYYQGVLIAIGTGANTTGNVQVRSDFNFDLPGSTADVNNLDPSIIRSFTSGVALTPFSVPYSGATNTATLLAADLSTYVGSGIVPVTVTGSLLTSSLGGTYHNISDIGESSPFAFVDKTKVFPVWGLQEFSLVASLTVAYEVPEPGTYAAGVAVALLAGHQWLARRRRSK
jgi:hypothetical protein